MILIRTTIFLALSSLLAGETTSFILRSTRTSSPAFVKWTTRFAEMGHLEPIPPPPPEESATPETPGIVGEGADAVPLFTEEPRVDSSDWGPETPGLNRADWPSPIQEPDVYVGPCDTPGLPPQTGI